MPDNCCSIFQNRMFIDLWLLHHQILKMTVFLWLIQLQRNRFQQLICCKPEPYSGILKLGCTELTYVELGAKTNGQYYWDVILSQHLLPAVYHISGDLFIFQENSAPTNWAHKMISCCLMPLQTSLGQRCGQLICRTKSYRTVHISET